MKKILAVLAFSLTVSSAFASGFYIGQPFESTFATTAITSAYPMATTLLMNSGYRYRGVAGREQIKDDLVALNDDVQAGLVKSVEEVRQPALKELMLEIRSDEDEMLKINEAIPAGTELFKLSNAAASTLLGE